MADLTQSLMNAVNMLLTVRYRNRQLQAQEKNQTTQLELRKQELAQRGKLSQGQQELQKQQLTFQKEQAAYQQRQTRLARRVAFTQAIQDAKTIGNTAYESQLKSIAKQDEDLKDLIDWRD